MEFLLEEEVQIVLHFEGQGGGHQKYPSRFLSSMEPSSSWSMARFSRSERRKEIISSMIFGTVSASERIAPVQGTQPRERMRHLTNFAFSPGRRSAFEWTRISEPPRSTTSRSRA